MKRALIAALSGCVALGLASFAVAGNNTQAGIAAHIGPDVQKNVCDVNLTNADIVYRLDFDGNCTMTNTFLVYLLVCNGSHVNGDPPNDFDDNGSGVSGTEFGILYNGAVGQGIDGIGWTDCADLTFTTANWPDSGEDITAVWADCQGTPSEPGVPNSVIAVVGAVRVEVHSPDALQVVPRFTNNTATVTDCSFVVDFVQGNNPSNLGAAGFCVPGYSPCGAPTPVQETTWGSIKSHFN